MTTTISTRGQTVVPAAIRRAFRLGANAKLEWIQDAHSIRVVPVTGDPIKAARGVVRKAALTKALLRARAADKRHE